MYYKERTEFGTLSFSSDSTVGDDLLDELCRSAEIDDANPSGPPPHKDGQKRKLWQQCCAPQGPASGPTVRRARTQRCCPSTVCWENRDESQSQN